MTSPTSERGGPGRPTVQELEERLRETEARLREAEETLEAIQSGEVDAVIVGGPGNQQVYTSENADRPYRLLVEQMQEGAVTISTDGTILYCNRHFSELLDIAQERVTGRQLSEFLPDAQRAAFDGLMGKSGRGGAKGEFALCGRRLGSIPVSISLADLPSDGDRIVCGIVSDLTQQVRREMAEEGFQTALDASGMGSWELDLLRDASRRSLRHDEIMGLPDGSSAWGRDRFLTQVADADRPSVAQAFDRALETGELEFECAIEPADGSLPRWVRIKGRTYYDDGNPVRMVGVVADVTGERSVQEQLRQAQKMEAVGQLTGGLAHDFNNLLTVILGNLELARGRAGDDTLLRQIEDARSAAQRGAGLTQKLLAFSRRQSLQPKVVRVGDLMPEMAALIGRAIGDDIEFTVSRDGGSWHCEVDPNQLESAILNLSINARDAMPNGGTLTVSTADVVIGPDEATERPGLVPGSYVLVSVADTGEGMSREVQGRVFEPFFTTKDIGKGSGLGLSMVYGFVKQSLGHVSIESEVGSGTTVRIYLPRTSARPASTSAPAPSPDVGTSGRPALILVVEDDPEVRRLAVSMVHALGHEPIEAANGPDAIAILECRPDIELLFTDIVMPKGMSGIDLARRARLLRPRLPVLLTSGFTAQSLSEETNGQHSFRLLRKPYRHDDLEAEIAIALSNTAETNGGMEEVRVSTEGLRVLVVEDEPLIAMVLEDYLLDLGCEVVGPEAKLDAALKAAEEGAFDVALLDVNIVGGTVFPVAEILGRGDVPFAFMTGSNVSSLPAPYSSLSNLSKPYTAGEVKLAVTKLASSRRRR